MHFMRSKCSYPLSPFLLSPTFMFWNSGYTTWQQLEGCINDKVCKLAKDRKRQELQIVPTRILHSIFYM
ncbi:hypothetical protein SLE2022_089330 [Rubroshorea leprosula]